MKKKILIIIPSLEIGGGAERSASILSKKLSETYHISILTFYDFKKSYSYEGEFNSLKLDSKFCKKCFIIFYIYKKIKLISPDLIISFIDHTNLLLIITKMLFLLKIPLIISVRTNVKERYKKQNKIQNFLIKILYKLRAVNKIVTLSNGVKEILIKNYYINKKKIITIYNGINSKEVKSKIKEELNLGIIEIFQNPKIIKFITMGRLIELKGHKSLITAFSKVKKHLPNSRLFIIGDGPLKEEYQSLINDLNLKDHIILLGLVKNPYKYLANSDIFVFSSLFEGFGMAILEAIACGLPVISTDCETGPREILNNGEYGMLVRVDDSDDLAEKMITLAKNEELLSYYKNYYFYKID
jgi:glycosyltransferase involved in cell wall biosynthesis